ncbi:MAG: Ig-like domain-containing protein, partial [Thermoplasmata archaeon]
IKDCVEPGEQMQILVFVKDVYGNPVSNADVKVSGEQGIILPERNQTDSDGKAVFVCTAPFVEKTVLMKLRVVAEKEGWESGNGYASFTVVGIMAQKQEQVDLGIVGIVVLSVIMALEVWMGKRGGNHKRRQ